MGRCAESPYSKKEFTERMTRNKEDAQMEAPLHKRINEVADMFEDSAWEKTRPYG